MFRHTTDSPETLSLSKSELTPTSGPGTTTQCLDSAHPWHSHLPDTGEATEGLRNRPVPERSPSPIPGEAAIQLYLEQSGDRLLNEESRHAEGGIQQKYFCSPWACGKLTERARKSGFVRKRVVDNRWKHRWRTTRV